MKTLMNITSSDLLQIQCRLHQKQENHLLSLSGAMVARQTSNLEGKNPLETLLPVLDTNELFSCGFESHEGCNCFFLHFLREPKLRLFRITEFDL